MSIKCNVNVICIGAGGTGGNFIKEFGRFLSFFRSEDKHVTLSIVDGDRVEQRNCARQPFIADDENQFKAVTMASAIIENFGLNEADIKAYPRYIDTVAELDVIAKSVYVPYRENLIVLVGAVDNHRARQVMHKFFYNQKNIIFIDSANEFRVGEVVVGIRIGGKNIAPPRSHYYEEIMKDKGKSASEMSCGEMNVSSPQHITTNLMAANICLSFVVDVLGGELKSGGIVYFDSKKKFSRFDEFTGKCPGQKKPKDKKKAKGAE